MAVVDTTEVWTPAEAAEGTPSVVLRRSHFMQRPPGFVWASVVVWPSMRRAVSAAMRCSVGRAVGWTMGSTMCGTMRAADWAQLSWARSKAGPISIAKAAAANVKLASGKVERILFTRRGSASCESRWCT